MIRSVGKTFGELVRAARESQGMKSYRLAELIGRRPSLISRIENGDYKETPPPDIVAGLSEALEIPQFELLRAIGYDVGPQVREPIPQDAEMERLVELLRQAKLNRKEREWMGDLLTSMRKANRDGAPE